MHCTIRISSHSTISSDAISNLPPYYPYPSSTSSSVLSLFLIIRSSIPRISLTSLEIIASRAQAWAHIASRKHNIIRVFAGDISNPSHDIMLQATLELGLKNGKTIELEFAARAEVVEWEGATKLQSFVVWTVCCAGPVLILVCRLKGG